MLGCIIEYIKGEIMISNELLGAVLNIEFSEAGFAPDGYSDFHHMKKYNIHELAHKCKKWAYDIDEYLLESALDYVNLFNRYACSDSEPDGIFTADTEPEAIFKACQWILDNKDK